MNRVPFLLAFLLLQFMANTQPFSYRLFSEKDGMPTSYTFKTFQDTRGFLWIGTNNGVSRFDGRHFVNFSLSNGLPDSRVENFVEDSSGNIWMATRGGLCRFDGHRFTTFAIPDSALTYYCFDLFINKDQSITVNYNQQYYQVKNEQVTRLQFPGFAGKKIRQRLALPNGENVYLLDGECVIEQNGKVNAVSGHQQKNVSVLARGDSLILITSSSITLYKNGLVSLLHSFSDSSKHILGNIIDRSGRIWSSFEEKGVVVVDPSRKSEYWITEENSPAQNFSAGIYQDRQGTIWISNLRGVVRVLDPTVLAHNNRPGEARLKIRGICQSSNNEVYAATETSVIRFDAMGNITALPPQVADVTKFTRQFDDNTGIASDAAGNIWLVKYNGRLFRINNNVATEVTKKFGVQVVAHGGVTWNPADNSILLPQPGGLLQIKNDSAFRYYYDSADRQVAQQRIMVDASGNAWITCRGKLWQFNGKSLVDRTSLSPVSPRSISFIHRRDNRYYFGTAGYGLFIMERTDDGFKKLNQLTVRDGMSNDALSAMTIDADGGLWIATASGLDRLKLTIRGWMINPQQNNDGINIGFWSAAKMIKDKRGYIWCGTSDGIVRIDADRLVKSQAAPSVFLESVSAIGREKEWQKLLDRGTGFFDVPSRKELPHQFNSLLFRFAGVQLINNALTYSYKLEPVDKDWNTLRQVEEASYYNLSPGKYKFHLKATGDNGLESSETIYEFEILPPFWKTWWFRTTVGIAIIAIIFAFVKRRERVISRRNETALRMSELRMQALQAQMNPHFIFNSLNSIQNYIINNNSLAAATYLAKFSKLIRRILDSSRQAFQRLEEIIETLRMYMELEAFRFNEEFSYKLDVDNDEDLLQMELPPMLFQPFVENAIWHGLMPKNGEKSLQVSIRKDNGFMICTIEDNGVGRNANQPRDGHNSQGEKITRGILDSMAILQNSHGEVAYTDKKINEVSQGTIVTIRIPLNPINTTHEKDQGTYNR